MYNKCRRLTSFWPFETYPIFFLLSCSRFHQHFMSSFLCQYSFSSQTVSWGKLWKTVLLSWQEFILISKFWITNTKFNCPIRSNLISMILFDLFKAKFDPYLVFKFCFLLLTCHFAYLQLHFGHYSTNFGQIRPISVKFDQF